MASRPCVPGPSRTARAVRIALRTSRAERPFAHSFVGAAVRRWYPRNSTARAPWETAPTDEGGAQASVRQFDEVVGAAIEALECALGHSDLAEASANLRRLRAVSDTFGAAEWGCQTPRPQAVRVTGTSEFGPRPAVGGVRKTRPQSCPVRAAK